MYLLGCGDTFANSKTYLDEKESVSWSNKISMPSCVYWGVDTGHSLPLLEAPGVNTGKSNHCLLMRNLSLK